MEAELRRRETGQRQSAGKSGKNSTTVSMCLEHGESGSTRNETSSAVIITEPSEVVIPGGNNVNTIMANVKPSELNMSITSPDTIPNVLNQANIGADPNGMDRSDDQTTGDVNPNEQNMNVNGLNMDEKRLSFSVYLKAFGSVEAILGILTLTFSILWKTLWRSPYDAMSSVLLFLAIVFLVTGALSFVAGVWFNKHEDGDTKYKYYKNACGQIMVIVTLMFVGIVIVGASLNAGHTKHTDAVFKLYFDDYAEKFNIDSAERLKKMSTKSAGVIVPTVVFFALLPCTIVLFVCAVKFFKVSVIGIADNDNDNSTWLFFNFAISPIVLCSCGIFVVFSLHMIYVRTPSDYGRTFAAQIPFMAVVSVVVLGVSVFCFTMHLCMECDGSYYLKRWSAMGTAFCFMFLVLIICVGCIGGMISHIILGYSHKYDNLGCIPNRSLERVCSGEGNKWAIDTDGEKGNQDGDRNKTECSAAIRRGVFHYNLLAGQVAPLVPRSDPPCYNLYHMAMELVETAQNRARGLHAGAAWLSVYGIVLPLALLLFGLIIYFGFFA